MHDDAQKDSSGTVATYIPELGSADPSWLGIAVATVDGHVYEVGDTALPFTIQSISKPFVFGLALEDHGLHEVLRRVGVEPSGNPFNSISVDPATNRPFNPMVNAGAIVTTSLVHGRDETEKLDRVLAMFERYVGHPVKVDEAVYESERASGDRNRAIGHLMRSFGMLEGAVDDAVDRYFRQCSVLVTCRDVALMTAVLANGGANPRTGAQVLMREHVAHVLSVMSTCGMYDYSGEWVYTVGLPAKSGVAGGVVAVLPGQSGVGVFSPPLDQRGNSVRGVRVCERLSRDFHLHLLKPPSMTRSVVRRSYRGTEARSTRVRPRLDDETLANRGAALAVYELQGDLAFSTMERAFRTVVENLDGVELILLDCKRVDSIDTPARAFLDDLATQLALSDRSLVLSHFAAAESDAAGHAGPSVDVFPTTDDALEWCEDRLLGAETSASDAAIVLAAHPLLRGVDRAELEIVTAELPLRPIPRGAYLLREGDPADSMYLLLEGSVSVSLRISEDGAHRVASYGAGCVLGETALLDEGQRTADVIAEEPSLVAVLPRHVLRHLEATQPHIATTIYRNLAADLAHRLRNANTQIRSLA